MSSTITNTVTTLKMKLTPRRSKKDVENKKDSDKPSSSQGKKGKKKGSKVTHSDEDLYISASETESAACGSCHKEVFEEDEAIQCETCHMWFHIKCQKVSQKKYKFLNSEEGQGLHWFCLICERTTLGMVTRMSALEAQVSKVEEKMEMKADKEEVQSEIKRLEDSLKTKVDIEAVEGLMKRAEPEPSTSKQAAEQDMMAKSISELEERDRRKKNLMFLSMEESESDDADTRKTHDIMCVKEICEELGEDVNVEKAVRLGEKKSDEVRRLKITFTAPEMKRNVLMKAKNLRSSKNEKSKKIFIKPDLTPFQRAEEQELLKEVRKKNAEAKGVEEQEKKPGPYMIKGGKVVKRPQEKKD